MRTRRGPRKADQAGRAPAVEATPLRLGDLRQAARDYVWLYDLRRGYSAEEIAARDGVGHSTVRDGIGRARALESDAVELLEVLADSRSIEAFAGLIPLFPIGALTPHSGCPHRGPLPAGSPLCCMVCHASGRDADGAGQGPGGSHAATRPAPPSA